MYDSKIVSLHQSGTIFKNCLDKKHGLKTIIIISFIKAVYKFLSTTNKHKKTTSELNPTMYVKACTGSS